MLLFKNMAKARVPQNYFLWKCTKAEIDTANTESDILAEDKDYMHYIKVQCIGYLSICFVVIKPG